MKTIVHTEELKQKVVAFERRYWRYRVLVRTAFLLPIVLALASLLALGNFIAPTMSLLIIVGVVGLIGIFFFQELKRPHCPYCDRTLSARSASD